MKKENPFKKLESPPKIVPENLKATVMNNVHQAKLLLDMLELFMTNYKSSMGSLFKTKKTKLIQS